MDLHKKGCSSSSIQSLSQSCDMAFRKLMHMVGIEFAPWKLPMTRRLQTLAATGWVIFMLLGEIICTAVSVYLMWTDYYWAMLIYAIIIARNRDSCNFGSRSWIWVRKWRWWEYFRDYFPLKLVKTQDLDPEKNYLFCVFPHGVFCTGSFGSFATYATGFQELFSGMTPHILTLGGHFMVPFFRELFSWLGFCSVSAESISFLLDKRNGTGRCAVLMVGGAAESLNCHAGEYRVVLQQRRGFVRLAIKSGAPLVPVLSFGETELYEQMSNPQGGRLRHFQIWFQKTTGLAPVLPLGRGIFQYNFGIVPQRRPVFTVVGKPMEVSLNPNPSEEEVNRIHGQFTRNLKEMFEKEKYKYLPNPKDTELIIE